MRILFATGNTHKVAEANKAGKKHRIAFERISCPYPEVRSESVKEIAEEGVKFVYTRVGKPVIVEDSGLFIQALDGFPGAYSSYVFGKLGNYGILRLMGGTGNRRAEFRSCVAYYDGETLKTFEGVVSGAIAEEARGDGGFGYDPIFMPEASAKTFAEEPKVKERVSHRKKSVESFAAWITSKRRP